MIFGLVLLATKIFLRLSNIVQGFKGLEVIFHYLYFIPGDRVIVGFRTLGRIPSPLGLWFANIDFIVVFVPFKHIFLHLPQLNIGIIDDDERFAFLHGFNCP